MGKLINNQSARKLIIAVAPYVYANKQLHLYFCVLVHYFVVLDIHLWKLYKNNYAAQAQWTLVNNCSLLRSILVFNLIIDIN